MSNKQLFCLQVYHALIYLTLLLMLIVKFILYELWLNCLLCYANRDRKSEQESERDEEGVRESSRKHTAFRQYNDIHATQDTQGLINVQTQPSNRIKIGNWSAWSLIRVLYNHNPCDIVMISEWDEKKTFSDFVRLCSLLFLALLFH